MMKDSSSEEIKKIRLDKWLWCARFLKTRTLATNFCTENRVRINGHAVQKAGAFIQVGDILTFAWQNNIAVVKVLGIPIHRGPSSEAKKLYEKIDQPVPTVSTD
ncbi:MAG: RNA-binding S4 domain-containing protein [Alphaproteobacteria bacterium]|nr:RNA-binding S4 domain-containing protein [Alphaproteobacteria bacterium]